MIDNTVHNIVSTKHAETVDSPCSKADAIGQHHWGLPGDASGGKTFLHFAIHAALHVVVNFLPCIFCTALKINMAQFGAHFRNSLSERVAHRNFIRQEEFVDAKHLKRAVVHGAGSVHLIFCTFSEPRQNGHRLSRNENEGIQFHATRTRNVFLISKSNRFKCLHVNPTVHVCQNRIQEK